jgi:hypothetical protein
MRFCYVILYFFRGIGLLAHVKWVKIYKTIIMPVVLYGCETCSLTLREENRLRMFGEQGSKENIWTKEE